MTTDAAPHQDTPVIGWVVVALAGALLAGVAMSWGQTLAPSGLKSLFNSATPVVALAAAVALPGRRPISHLLLGASAGPLAMVGYYATTALRDFGVSMRMVLFWCIAGVIAGLAAGLAVWLLRGHGPMWQRGVAAAVLPATAVGEAAHGLVRVLDTTSGAYWVGLGVAGLVLLGWLVVRLEDRTARICAVAATVLLATALFVVYGAA